MKYSDDIISHEKKGKFEYIKFKELEKYSDKLNHFITMRYGGKSQGIYSSLNMRNVSLESTDIFFQNVKIICDNMNLDENNIYKAKQNHTDNILLLNDMNKDRYKLNDFSKEEYDAYIIKDKNISNYVTTADCNPIIIYDTKKNIVANIHAGWKGVLKKIYLKTLNEMLKKFDVDLDDLIICIGPSIRKCCFSSEDENFKKEFTDVFEDEKEYIYYENNSSRFHIDLVYLIKRDFMIAGIKEKNINIANICTCCNHDDFYSYRIAKKNNESDYSTFSTWVELK